MLMFHFLPDAIQISNVIYNMYLAQTLRSCLHLGPDGFAVILKKNFGSSLTTGILYFTFACEESNKKIEVEQQVTDKI